MKIDDAFMQKVASLAKLELTEQESEIFKQDFKDVLKAFSVLDKLDVDKEKSSFRPLEEKNVLRTDEVIPSLSQKEALQFTEDKEQGFFIGPRTIE